MQYLESRGTPVLYIWDARFLKVNNKCGISRVLCGIVTLLQGKEQDKFAVNNKSKISSSCKLIDIIYRF